MDLEGWGVDGRIKMGEKDGYTRNGKRGEKRMRKNWSGRDVGLLVLSV